MSNKKVLSVIGGEVIMSHEDQAGVIPAVTIADSAVVDLGAFYSGVWVVEITDESAILTSTISGASGTIDRVAGSAVISDTKDTASSINVYVESDTIQIQNLTGADVIISAKIL